LRAPDSSHLPSRTSTVDAMMPAVMMPPVVVVAPVTGVADTARTIIGHDDAAAGIRVIGVIVVRVIIVIASGEEAPEVVPVVEPMTAMTEAGRANATAGERWAGAERAAMNGRAAADAATTPTVSTSVAATVATADFGRQPVGGDFGRGRSPWIDQRQRLRALAVGREGQERRGRKAHNAAPEKSNLQHV